VYARGLLQVGQLLNSVSDELISTGDQLISSGEKALTQATAAAKTLNPKILMNPKVSGKPIFFPEFGSDAFSEPVAYCAPSKYFVWTDLESLQNLLYAICHMPYCAGIVRSAHRFGLETGMW
jgi:hypothetical protein